MCSTDTDMHQSHIISSSQNQLASSPRRHGAIGRRVRKNREDGNGENVVEGKAPMSTSNALQGSWGMWIQRQID